MRLYPREELERAAASMGLSCEDVAQQIKREVVRIAKSYYGDRSFEARWDGATGELDLHLVHPPVGPEGCQLCERVFLTPEQRDDSTPEHRARMASLGFVFSPELLEPEVERAVARLLQLDAAPNTRDPDLLEAAARTLF